MLRLLSSKEQGRKDFWKPFKPCHVGIHWIALAEHSQMSTHLPGFPSFLKVFCIVLCWPKLATSSIRFKGSSRNCYPDLWYFWQYLWHWVWFYQTVEGELLIMLYKLFTKVSKVKTSCNRKSPCIPVMPTVIMIYLRGNFLRRNDHQKPINNSHSNILSIKALSKFIYKSILNSRKCANIWWEKHL